jgi:hypothetical protein
MTTTKPRNDAYIGLLFASLVALLTGCALLFLDYTQYGGHAPPALTIPSAN